MMQLPGHTCVLSPQPQSAGSLKPRANTRTVSLQSQAMKANGQVFVSGQIPMDSVGTLIEGSVADKTELCCRNLIAVLTAAGSSIDKVVKVNVRCTKPRSRITTSYMALPSTCDVMLIGGSCYTWPLTGVALLMANGFLRRDATGLPH